MTFDADSTIRKGHQNQNAPVLAIYLLGDFRLVYRDTLLTGIATPRQRSLLAYLILHRDAPQPRQHLAFLFWPDSSEAQARTNLRYLLHTIRQALPEADQFLHVDAQVLYWRPEAPWTLDVVAFERGIAQATTTGELQQAVDRYQGDLLPSCYEEWILPERERLCGLFAGACERLI